MSETSRTDPGPWWLWVAAWTLQGGGILLVASLGIGSPHLQFVSSGLVAAVPLVGLFLLLKRRPA